MTETMVIERALIVMAACLVIQTIGMTVGTIALFVAWRRTTSALDGQMAEMQTRIDRVSNSVEDAAQAFERTVASVHEAVDGTRDAVKTAAAVMISPPAALALGALRGLQWWRRRRAERRPLVGAPQPRLIVHNRSQK